MTLIWSWKYFSDDLLRAALCRLMLVLNKDALLHSIQFIQWPQMHAQQSFLNVCNTTILGYHVDKIILYKNVKNIKHGKNHRLFNYQICQDHKHKKLSFNFVPFHFILSNFVHYQYHIYLAWTGLGISFKKLFSGECC